MTPQEALAAIDEAVQEIGEIANDLQQGQMIEEDDALGRRLVGLQVRITNATASLEV